MMDRARLAEGGHTRSRTLAADSRARRPDPFGALLDEKLRKRFTAGTHRIATPGETLARFMPLMHAMGVTRLGLTTGLDFIGIPVAVAVRPNASSIAVSQGKGWTEPQALASALMESAELFHAETADGAVLERATALEGEAVFAPEGGRALEWMLGWDLLRQAPCWAPAANVRLDFRRKPDTDYPGATGTNGLGSGNHLVEALCAAICEVAERDAMAVWHARPLAARAATRIGRFTIEDAGCAGLLRIFDEAGFSVAIWNVTSDLGIPAFLAMLRQDRPVHGVQLREFHGSGCHPCPAVALSRALTEAAQSRLTRIAGARDDMAEQKPSAEATIARLLLDGLAAEIAGDFGAIAGGDGDDLGDDLRWMLQLLEAAGISRVIAFDLTKPALGLPVVRVVIPELESSREHPSYVPGPRARRAAAERA